MVTSCETDRCPGSTTSTTDPAAVSDARSASSSAASYPHRCASVSSTSDRSGAERTSAAPSSNAGRRAPSGSPGQLARATSTVVGFSASGPGSGTHSSTTPAPARPGHRDIGEPALLPYVMLAPLRMERLDRGGDSLLVTRAGQVEDRQPGSVAAQRERQHAKPVQPVVRGAGAAGEHASGQAGDRDHVPLQPLGRMRGQDLYGSFDHLDLARREPPLLELGGRQVGEEAGQRATVGVGAEPRRDVAERVEVPASQPGVARPGSHLHVKAGGPFDVGDQVRQRLVEPAAQGTQLIAQGGQTPVPLWRVPLRRAEVIERLDQSPFVKAVGEPRLIGCSGAGSWARVRTTTAVGGRRSTGISYGGSSTPAAVCHAATRRPASQDASSRYVSNSAQWTVAVEASSASRSAGASSATRWPKARSGADSALATSRISGRLRQLVLSVTSRAGVPSARGNSAGKRSRVPALAPRQP